MSCDLEFPSDRLQSGYANTNASLTQDGLATIEDGVTYTLEVDVGRRSDDSNSTCCTALDFAVSLLAAGDPVATNDENAIAGGIPNPGAFGTLTLSFTGTPATAGQSLGIELASFADQTNWDDVRHRHCSRPCLCSPSSPFAESERRIDRRVLAPEEALTVAGTGRPTAGRALRRRRVAAGTGTGRESRPNAFLRIGASTRVNGNPNHALC